MSKVVKFGGSSLASAEQFKKVGNIIRADKERKYVVPSAVPASSAPAFARMKKLLSASPMSASFTSSLSQKHMITLP